MWETFMWHYRPWKPIVDGKFLPKPNGENEKESVMAFLPEHPNTLMKNGEFNKVFPRTVCVVISSVKGDETISFPFQLKGVHYYGCYRK